MSGRLLQIAANCLRRAIATVLLFATLVLNTLPTEEYEYDELRGSAFTVHILDAVGSSRAPIISVKFDDGRGTLGKSKSPLGCDLSVLLAPDCAVLSPNSDGAAADPSLVEHAVRWLAYSSRAPPPALSGREIRQA